MIVGMDFGTTNSGMAVYDGGELRFVPLDPANRNPHVARTALYITTDNEVYLGSQATAKYYEQNLNRPFKLDKVWVGEVEMTFAEIGTFIRDVFIEKDVYAPGRLFRSFKMGLSSLNYLGTIVGTDYYYLEDIIAVYLHIAKRRAEAHFGHSLDTIVLGRPVRFTDDETHNALAQERLLQAAYRAGYERVYFQYEPIAAAQFYAQTVDRAENVLIFDFGGGTLDLSVLHIAPDGTREVLATGGIAIAGDVFDRKIVRAKFPPHFGEGSTYRSNGRDLPVPPSFFDAFTNWQELLLLQMPDTMERLQQIARSASDPRRLNALISLIGSFAALQMFDIAEGAKRQLSGSLRASLSMSGKGYSVLDAITRSEFERLIRPEVRAIEERLDEMLTASGLRDDQIDVVIRTGGSSQIPAFINMLNSRFGEANVREVDAFSSVTAGLGIVGHQIEQGRSDIPYHTPATSSPPDYLAEKQQGGVPVLDLERMLQFIQIQEQRERTGPAQQMLALVGEDDRLRAYGEGDDQIDLESAAYFLGAAPGDAKHILMTTDYRFLTKSLRQLADWREVGIQLEEVERFRSDKFSSERVCGIQAWDPLANSEHIFFMTTLGYGRLMPADSLLTKLGQPVPYQMKASRGFPAALLPVQSTGEIVILSQAGRAIRVLVSDLSRIEQRLLAVPLRSGVVGAVAIDQPGTLLIVTASGYAKRIATSAIPIMTEPGTNGTKILTRANPLLPLVDQPDRDLVVITNQRRVTVPSADIPQSDLDKTDHKLLNLGKGERVVGVYFTAEDSRLQ